MTCGKCFYLRPLSLLVEPFVWNAILTSSCEWDDQLLKEIWDLATVKHALLYLTFNTCPLIPVKMTYFVKVRKIAQRFQWPVQLTIVSVPIYYKSYYVGSNQFNNSIYNITIVSKKKYYFIINWMQFQLLLLLLHSHSFLPLKKKFILFCTGQYHQSNYVY